MTYHRSSPTPQPRLVITNAARLTIARGVAYVIGV